MSAETKVICNHEGLKEGAHIIHAVGCKEFSVFGEAPKPKGILKPTPIGTHITTPLPSQVNIPRSGGT